MSHSVTSITDDFGSTSVSLTCTWSSSMPAVNMPSPASRYEGSTWRHITLDDSLKGTWSFFSSILSGWFNAINMADTRDKWQQRGSGETSGFQSQIISGSSGVSTTKTTTIRLRDLYDPKPQSPRQPVLIRPPGPRTPLARDPNLKPSAPIDPPVKAIMRRRAQSLPSSAERKKELRSLQVRFVDSLGLELEEVKVFRVQEHPMIPQHVKFRLLMSSELAFGKSLELSLPYFKPCFPDNMAARPDFWERLHSRNVCLEQVLCSDHGITGTIQVLNLAYEKQVMVHYSFTNWRTHTDAPATWVSSAAHGDGACPETDTFRFRLPVPPFILQPGAILEFAIHYHVRGSDYWDNNNGDNYKLSCHSYKVTVPRECENSLLHFT